MSKIFLLVLGIGGHLLVAHFFPETSLANLNSQYAIISFILATHELWVHLRAADPDIADAMDGTVDDVMWWISWPERKFDTLRCRYRIQRLRPQFVEVINRLKSRKVEKEELRKGLIEVLGSNEDILKTLARFEAGWASEAFLEQMKTFDDDKLGKLQEDKDRAVKMKASIGLALKNIKAQLDEVEKELMRVAERLESREQDLRELEAIDQRLAAI